MTRKFNFPSDGGSEPTTDQESESGSTVVFTDVPDTVTAGDGVSFPFLVNLKELYTESEDDDGSGRIELFGDEASQKFDAEVEASLLVNGVSQSSVVDSTKTIAEESSVVEGSLNHTFSSSDTGASTVTNSVVIRVDIDYEVEEQSILFEYEEVASTPIRSLSVENNTLPESFTDFQGDSADDSTQALSKAYDERVPFKIVDLEAERDSDFAFTRTSEGDVLPSRNSAETDEKTTLARDIEFDEFPNPNVAIDGAGRFAKHEIIGGATVRQKIGEDPLNISINGVCNQQTANRIDGLRNIKKATIISSRLPGSTSLGGNSSGGSSLTVQFGSTSTEPLEDGGAADLKTGELLYSYTIEAIEVTE